MNDKRFHRRNQFVGGGRFVEDLQARTDDVVDPAREFWPVFNIRSVNQRLLGRFTSHNQHGFIRRYIEGVLRR